MTGGGGGGVVRICKFKFKNDTFFDIELVLLLWYPMALSGLYSCPSLNSECCPL